MNYGTAQRKLGFGNEGDYMKIELLISLTLAIALFLTGCGSTVAGQSASQSGQVFMESDSQISAETSASPKESKTPETQSQTNVTTLLEKHQTPSSIYSDILKSKWTVADMGALYDYDRDGILELIMLDTNLKDFRMYDCDQNLHIKECYFGRYTAVSSVKLFCADGDAPNQYFYWRCNYEYMSVQGYYDPSENNEIDIGIQYNEDGNGWIADWKLWSNDRDYDSGSEKVDTYYAATPDCYRILLHMFMDCGFSLDNNSRYTEINLLSYEELIERLRSS